MWRFALSLFLACLLLGADAAPVLKKIEAPCTACKAVAAELQRRIDQEPVRNHLDLRHRLDKDGQRYGKVIAYKSSELRAVELLDGLCDRMRDYALVSPTGKKTKFWLKVKGEGNNGTMLSTVTRAAKAEEEAKSKRLESYCGVLLEELEEELYVGIMKGGFDAMGVEPVLCRGIISACPSPAAAAPPADAAAAGEVVEEEEQDGEAEAAEEPSPASSGSAAGSPSTTQYIDNMKVELGSDGKLEL